jgi:hypothetical protein
MFQEDGAPLSFGNDEDAIFTLGRGAVVTDRYCVWCVHRPQNVSSSASQWLIQQDSEYLVETKTELL